VGLLVFRGSNSEEWNTNFEVPKDLNLFSARFARKTREFASYVNARNFHMAWARNVQLAQKGLCYNKINKIKKYHIDISSPQFIFFRFYFFFFFSFFCFRVSYHSDVEMTNRATRHSRKRQPEPSQ